MRIAPERLMASFHLQRLLGRPAMSKVQRMAANKLFWQRHPGLVWSNPEAEDAIYIRAALLRCRFGQLLEIATEFGFERVQAEWQYLLGDPTLEVERARPLVERILKNIATGFALASTKD